MIPSCYQVACHTDNVGIGTTFVAIKGAMTDGARFIVQAVHQGASTIVVDAACSLDHEIKNACAVANVPLRIVANARKELALLSAQAAGNPAGKLKIIGVTGTKGKTTCTFMLEHALRSAGYKTALLSTVYNKINDAIFSTCLTTQQPDYLHLFLKACFEQKVDYVVMEVAAQAVSLWRVYGIEFEAVLFTNFGNEHGEFYANQKDYFQAKIALLSQIKPGRSALLNGDDPLLARVALDQCAIRFFGKNANALCRLTIQESNGSGSSFVVQTLSSQPTVFFTPLLGAFNIYNWLGVLALLDTLMIPITMMRHAVESFCGAPGRLELYILPNGAHCYIDYAHNPLSFQAILSTLRSYTSHLIALFGAGGDRDPVRRPQMGVIAASYADAIILTTDNPRSEDPQKIINEIENGIDSSSKSKIWKELDRAEAIKKAYALSTPSSLIVLLGKGAERYQLIKGEKHPFSEPEILKSLN